MKNYEENIKKLLPNATSYIRAFNNVVSHTSNQSREACKKELHDLSKHDFAIWLNNQPAFKAANKKMRDNHLIKKSIDDINSHYIGPYIKQSALEFICANCLKNIVENFESLEDAIVIPSKMKEMTLKFKTHLMALSQTFELEAQSQLFNYLIYESMQNPISIYNSGKKHPDIVREYFTKRIMAHLCTFFKGNATNSCLIDVTLDIVGLFFTPMDRDNASKLFKKVKSNQQKNEKFMNKLVKDLIPDAKKLYNSNFFKNQ